MSEQKYDAMNQQEFTLWWAAEGGSYSRDSTMASLSDLLEYKKKQGRKHCKSCGKAMNVHPFAIAETITRVIMKKT